MPARRRHRPGLLAPAPATARAWSLAIPDSRAPSPLRAGHAGDRAEPVAPLVESLARLTGLREQGLLTDAEFAAATARLLQ
ncbi:hypothetical protein [Arthrobacter agilis]|uniref:hypothetical protein n=1 Tax=Arthrobacter agilis TaxID=37921 RepID=UPI00278B7260|nr:hypothetical protein [Arthrobacter agilis]MDQ0736576.1 hypothetical protein [Arthrobacter agilis]